MRFFRFLHDIIINICGCARPSRKTGFKIGFGLPTTKTKEPMPAEVSITTEQKITATLTPVTDTGKPAKVDGVPTWEVVSGNATVVPSEDGMSAELISSDDPGDTQFIVRADAHLGAEVEEISDVILLHSVGATAKNLGLTLGAPVPK